MFNPISSITSSNDLRVFKELVDVYCRLIEVRCEEHKIKIQQTDNVSHIIQELIDIGVITSPDDLPALEKCLSSDYHRFVSCVAFAISNKKLMGDALCKLSNKERVKLAETAGGPSLVDFFCGAGGLSLGFVQNGFQIKLANDIEDVCIETYRYNHPDIPDSHVVQGDIKKIVDHIEDFNLGDVDIVIGGPPCQGFSEANRQRIINDPRNLLYKYYIQAVEKIAPKFVLMENVKGMLNVANQVIEDYESIIACKNGTTYSYKVSYQVLNSHDFNVAQSRERLIYIAIRNDVMLEKNISPRTIFDEIDAKYKNDTPFTLSDALAYIKPLEAPRVKNQNEVDSIISGKKIDNNPYKSHSNAYLSLVNQNKTLDYTFNHKARYLSDVNYEIYKRLNQGDDATNEKIKDIMPYAHRNHCFKDKYYKLFSNRPCRTITAHLRMDCHSHIHPFQIRSLTPREAARVQSFPDDYLFLGPYLKTYMQIGNAVPPMMARGIASIIRKYI